MFLPALDRRIALLPASVRRRSPAARRPLRTSTRLHEQSSTHPDKQPSDYGEGSSRLPNPPPSNPEDLSYQTADDIPRTSEPNADLGEASSSMRLRRTQGGFGLAQRPRSPPWKEKTSGDADKETLDRFLGIDKATANVSSFHRPPPKDDFVVDDDEGLSVDLSPLFGQYKPKSNPFADPPNSSAHSHVVPSPRSQKGVHSRYRRAQGQTPEEAAAFNQVLNDIFADLGRQGPLRPGSSPLSDPYGKESASGDTLWGPRLRQKRRGLYESPENEEDDAVVEELEQLKEEMSVIATDAELVDWATRRVFSPVSSDENGFTFSKAYPRILAHLLKVVRTNFNNPHLALALFHHAQTHSLESYLIGCLAPVYDEILHVRWGSFRDLEGVEQAAREMEVNGVKWDNGTQKIVGRVVEEVGQEILSEQGHVRYGDEVYDRLARLDARVQKDIRAQDNIYERKKAERENLRSDWIRKSNVA